MMRPQILFRYLSPQYLKVMKEWENVIICYLFVQYDIKR